MNLNSVIARNGKLYTPSIDTGFTEETITIEGKKYREWHPMRSKLAAAIMKGMQVAISPESTILYLGAAHGYTPSFLSQICGKGKIFAVEFSARVARELVLLALRRPNILPVVEDANQAQRYYHMVQAADIIYQDIAQQNQVEILEKNSAFFLKKGGIAMVAIKARSIDVTEKPAKIYADVKRQLSERFTIIDYRNLEPFQKDHAFFVCRKK